MANEAHSAELAIIISYPTSLRGIIVLLKTIKKYCKILLILLEQLKDNLMVAISLAMHGIMLIYHGG